MDWSRKDASNVTGLAADVDVELLDDEEDDDAVLAVLCGMGINVGNGEVGVGDEDGDVIDVAFTPAGSTKAISPFANLVGSNWVPLALVKNMPFDCCT